MMRSEYMDSSSHRPDNREHSAAMHRKYYGQFVSARTKAYVARIIGKDAILNSQDEHFNDIPLHRWDALTKGLPLAISFKETGDYATLAGLVCVAKEAARQIKEENI